MSLSQLQQLEKTWESEIKEGNRLFQSSVFAEASIHYTEAMIISELLLENIATASRYILQMPGMYFTACINLAYNYWGMQDYMHAADYFLYCTFKLKQLSADPGIDPVIKQSASTYWLKALQLYTSFSEKTGMPMPANLDQEDTYLQLQKLKDLFIIRNESMN